MNLIKDPRTNAPPLIADRPGEWTTYKDRKKNPPCHGRLYLIEWRPKSGYEFNASNDFDMTYPAYSFFVGWYNYAGYFVVPATFHACRMEPAHVYMQPGLRWIGVAKDFADWGVD